MNRPRNARETLVRGAAAGLVTTRLQLAIDKDTDIMHTVMALMTRPDHGGRAAKIFLFLGGMHEFKGRWASRAYLSTWLVMLAICGAACWANLAYMEVPSHNTPTDFLTAYVHIPAIQGWLFWRRQKSDPKFHSMVKVPPWRRHSWPPRAPQSASEGLRPPSTLVKRGLVSRISPGGRGNGVFPCPSPRFRRV